MIDSFFQRFRIICCLLSLLLFFPITPSAESTREHIVKLKNEAQAYYWGQHRRKDLSKALELYLEAASYGDSEARYIAGAMYYKGYGTPKDDAKAFSLLHDAANRGTSTPQSERVLGTFFVEGRVTPKNYQEATRWFIKAAENGDAEAQCELGFMYYTGENGTQDYTKALYWYTQSAKQGIAAAQYSLGVMYYSGIGMAEHDLIQAYAWVSLAALQNHSDALHTRAYLESMFSRDELTLAQNAALELFTQYGNLSGSF